MPAAKNDEGVKSVSADGRRYFTDEFKAQVAKEAAEHGYGGQKLVSEKYGLVRSLVNKWCLEAKAEEARTARAAKRAATLAANKAVASSTNGVNRETTLVSRPAPASAPVSALASTKPRGVRSFETVSLELAGAIDKVRELKRELRAMLGDD